MSADAIRDLAVRLVRDDEIDESEGTDAIVDAAVAAHARIWARADVRALYAAGRTFHEVPFTMMMDGRIVRGTVDCLVETAPGRFTVLEFKTGRPHPEHQAQVEIYVQAMRQAFPEAAVDSRLIYPKKNAEFQLFCAN
jgi:ATP-dependent exoDNAse (exonuclease V) beta subunit